MEFMTNKTFTINITTLLTLLDFFEMIVYKHDCLTGNMLMVIKKSAILPGFLFFKVATQWHHLTREWVRVERTMHVVIGPTIQLRQRCCVVGSMYISAYLCKF